MWRAREVILSGKEPHHLVLPPALPWALRQNSGRRRLGIQPSLLAPYLPPAVSQHAADMPGG